MVPDEQLLAWFFIPTKRERYAEMIGHPKKRPKFLLELAHLNSLDQRYVLPMPPKKLFPEHIAAILTQKGAPQTCWVTSENHDLDGREMPLLEALKEVVGCQMGAFLTCIPGKLAYYEGEAMCDRWILERRD
jgi:hypothetical protein